VTSRRIVFLLFGSLGLVLGLQAQDFDRYQRLQCEGDIPNDFLLSATSKYQLQLQHWSDSSREVREALAAFYREDYYYVNQLLHSGKVLFNDPVSEYIAKVADQLLAGQPEIREQLRFYAVKSSVANAFATTDGIILVNLGLLAKLENEAQLAFILAHEISHYLAQHPIEIFLSLYEQENGQNRLFRRTSAPDLLLARNFYSKEKEQEADIMGLGIYLAGNYELEAAETVFNILKYAEKPFGNRDFDRDFLQSPAIHFLNHHWLDTLVIPAPKLLDDQASLSTHPEPDARRDTIAIRLASVSAEGRFRWQLGQSYFEKIQRICRYELCHLYLVEQAYESALYAAYFLAREHGMGSYLSKTIAHSLYGLTKYTNNGRFWDVHVDFNEVSGPAQKVHYLIEQLSDAERNVLALSWTWREWQKNQQDQELNAMVEDLMQELGIYYADSLHFFQKGVSNSVPDLESRESFARTGLADLMEDVNFYAQLGVNLFLGQRKRQETNETEDKKTREQKQNALRIQGFNLGLDSVVFVNPTYQRLDKRKKSEIRFLESEAAENQFTEQLEAHAESLELAHTTLNYGRLDGGQVATFNDLAVLNEWIAERNQQTDLKMVSPMQDEVQYLRQRYGTPYFVWTQGVAVTGVRPGRKMMLFMGVILPLLPYSLYYVFTPDHNLYFYTAVYDLEQGDYLIVYPKRLQMNDRRDVINSVAYDLIYQLKTAQP
jgi:Zn-dependent protease with chaperone function